MCDLCPYDCYDGSVVVNYTVVDVTPQYTVSSILLVREGYEFESDVTVALNLDYPLYSANECYYQSDDPSDVRYSYDDGQGALIASIVLVTLAICLLYYCCGGPCPGDLPGEELEPDPMASPQPQSIQMQMHQPGFQPQPYLPQPRPYMGPGQQQYQPAALPGQIMQPQMQRQPQAQMYAPPRAPTY